MPKPMSARAFNHALETLGLSQSKFAALTSVNPRTVRSYASGDDPVPPKLQLLLDAWLLLNRRGWWVAGEGIRRP